VLPPHHQLGQATDDGPDAPRHRSTLLRAPPEFMISTMGSQSARRVERPPTVGLALIARNEEDTLPRLLASCAGAFDEVVLVDTGSIDATVQRFEAWAQTQATTRCRVEHFEWCDDFARARQFADDQLSTDWRVWADCDDEIRGAGSLRELAAAADPDLAAYFCAYDYAGADDGAHFVAKRERLVRAGHGKWVGRIHEVQEIDGSVAEVDPARVIWVHHGDGGAHPRGGPSRAVRDLELLEAEVAEDPYNPRAVFYLAQTHRDLGHLDEAIRWYDHRADMGGWAEEVFYARYQAGALRADRGDWPEAMAGLLDAWEFRPSRIEPLHELAWRLRVAGRHRTAHAFALAGLEAPLPDDQLFVHRWVYVWGIRFEYSIAAYWVGDVTAALEACERLLSLDELPHEHRLHVLANRAFCRERLRVSQRSSQPSTAL
jgi:glycosyltransferase involved in cell wall biosynthesis